MKKITTISLITISFLLFSNVAKAEFYFGLDAVGSNAKYDMKSDPNSTAQYRLNGDQTKMGSAIGAGIGLGYKFRIYDYFIAPELYYEYLGNGVKVDGLQSVYDKGEMKVKSRSMAKLNIGKKINEYFDIFIYGASCSPDVSNPGTENILTDGVDINTRASVILGLGTYIHLNKDWDIKFAYDYQKIKIEPGKTGSSPFAYEVAKTSIELHTLKIGIVYNF